MPRIVKFAVFLLIALIAGKPVHSLAATTPSCENLGIEDCGYSNSFFSSILFIVMIVGLACLCFFDKDFRNTILVYAVVILGSVVGCALIYKNFGTGIAAIFLILVFFSAEKIVNVFLGISKDNTAAENSEFVDNTAKSELHNLEGRNVFKNDSLQDLSAKIPDHKICPNCKGRVENTQSDLNGVARCNNCNQLVIIY
jgi:hypothetical protein